MMALVSCGESPERYSQVLARASADSGAVGHLDGSSRGASVARPGSSIGGTGSDPVIRSQLPSLSRFVLYLPQKALRPGRPKLLGRLVLCSADCTYGLG